MLGWVAWEIWQVFWTQELTFGITGVFVQQWMGLGIGGAESWANTLSTLGLAFAFGAITGGTAAGLALRRPPRLGFGLLALGTGALFLWALFSGVFGVGTALDGRLRLPIFAVGFQVLEPGAAWSHWVFDASALVAVSILAGFGPNTPLAMRALWVGLLAVIADNAWRFGVTLLTGQIPLLYRGLGAGDAVFSGAFGQSTPVTLLVVWTVLGALALLFVAVFANLPSREGPHRVIVLIGLGLAGLILGFEAFALYSIGLLEAMGMQPVNLWANPEYPGMLAFLRLGWVAVGATTLGLAAWRLGE